MILKSHHTAEPSGTQSQHVSQEVSAETIARIAREKRQYDVSIPAWERLVKQEPSRWEFALALALDLRAVGRRVEEEEVLRRTVLSHPDRFWVGFHWAYGAFEAGNLDLAELAARKFRDQFPTHREPHQLLGDIALAQLDFRGATLHFQTALECAPDNTLCAERLCKARLRDRVTRAFPPLPAYGDHSEASNYVILVINLDKSRERRDRVYKGFQHCGPQIARIPAVYGSYLPLSARKALTGSAEYARRRGTLGCFLSHVSAWEWVVTNGAQHCLIVEDDVLPTVRLPLNVSSLAIPADYDICFVNQRMERVIPIESIDKINSFQVCSPAQAVASMPGSMTAPGGDGYFLSAAGAQRLLTAVEQDGYRGDVDWRLLAYTVSKDELTQLPMDYIANAVIAQTHRALDHEGTLRGYSLYPSLICTAAVDSERMTSDRTEPI